MFLRKFLIPAMNLLGRRGIFSRAKKAALRENLAHNRAQWKIYCSSEKKPPELPYITNQDRLTFLRYGRTRRLLSRIFLKGRPLTAAFNCCEVIAAMNAMLAAGAARDSRDFPELLAHFERRGIILSGYLGTAPGEILRYLRSLGLDVVDLSIKSLADHPAAFPAYIYVAQNGRSLFSEVHTMCIINTPRGFRLLNDFEKDRVYPSPRAAIAGYRGGDNTPLALYGVRGHR